MLQLLLAFEKLLLALEKLLLETLSRLLLFADYASGHFLFFVEFVSEDAQFAKDSLEHRRARIRAAGGLSAFIFVVTIIVPGDDP